MDESYIELKKITDGLYEFIEKTGFQLPYGPAIIRLLNKYGIRLRQDDGRLTQCNISIPKNKSNAIVVGLRYLKENGMKTEDHFIFEEGKKIDPRYRATIEEVLPEYKGAHDLQR